MLEEFRSMAALTQMEQNSIGKVGDKFETMPRPTSKIIKLNQPRIWMVAAAIITLAVVSTFVLTKLNLFPDYSSEQLAVRPTVYSGKQFLLLPDGTQVTLNEDSELSYDSATYGKSKREVVLKGEAFFDVMHDPSKQFVVKTGAVNTKVLGTAFNIRAYPAQKEITVTVARGLVQVGDDERVYGRINPNEQIAVDTETLAFVQSEVEVTETVQWRSKFLILPDVSLEEAAKIIGDKFKVQIKFQNEALKKCRYEGTFLNDESLQQVLSAMSKLLRMTYSIEGNTVTLNGEGCE